MTATERAETPPQTAPNRIADAFAKAKGEGRTAIIPFVTVGYPTLAQSEAWALAAIRGGADLLEIGIPFSDPLADGPTVQRTSQVALEQGTTLPDGFALARALRQIHGVEIPILLMGYYNPILRYGLDRLAAECAAAGIDGYIVPDLPAEESDELVEVFRRHGLDLIFLLAPTSTDARISAVAERAGGFIYCVSLTGVTGQRDTLPDLTDYLARVRARTSLPIAIGFGVSTPDHVRQVGEVADGAVVASAFMNFLDTVDAADQSAAAEQFVRGLRGEAEFPSSGARRNPQRETMAPDVLPSAATEEVDRAEIDVENTVRCRGIRGAITVESNTAEDIKEATTDLLEALIRLNDIQSEDVVSAIFTTTPELTAAFPALAARDLGWTEVPLLCAHEMDVPGALRGVVRILLHVNTGRAATEVRHIYLGEARGLRPEWALDDDELAAVLGRRPGASAART